MPDTYGFNHEVHRGEVFHRCTECDEYPWGTRLSEAQRRRHHERHVRDRQRQIERTRDAHLAEARRLKRQAERENRLAHSRHVDSPSTEIRIVEDDETG